MVFRHVARQLGVGLDLGISFFFMTIVEESFKWSVSQHQVSNLYSARREQEHMFPLLNQPEKYDSSTLLATPAESNAAT
jgi:hypothetical protein